MSQEPFVLTTDLDQWQINLSSSWDVLGPFPIHAREQHFLSPGFPINLTSPYRHEENGTWTSSLSENAEVTWRKAQADPRGSLVVSFPDVRWQKIRATEGWAGLQYHSILHTTLVVRPPRSGKANVVPRIRVQLIQGSFFTVLSRESLGRHAEWHSGNIYAMNRSPPNSVELPGKVHADRPTIFDFFVSGDYEIRLFGDPRDGGGETPTLRINVAVSLEEKRNTVVRQESHDVACDFVNGFAFGDALGVGLRSIGGWWTVERLEFSEQFPKNISLTTLHKQLIAPSQTRTVPILISQTGEYDGREISFNVILTEHLLHDNRSNPENLSVPVTLAVRNLPLWNSSRQGAIRATFFFVSSHPTHFLVKPPIAPSRDGRSVPFLALHGAGVDILSSSFWSDAVPRQEHSWIVLPVGRTEWGLDWHSLSASEAWATLSALSDILGSNEKWKPWSFSPNSRALILGHSNGGQGAWYLASRYPDRTHALLAAAGFLSAAAYVPLTQARGARFVDPALRAVLESSFTADDNALFLGNLAGDVSVLAVHGGEDTNVPTWHSREYVSIIRSLGKGLNVSFHLDEGQPHWYENVFETEQVQSFLEKVLDSEVNYSRISKTVSEFTLTVADTAHSGSLNGFRIDALLMPGRLGRLHVKLLDDETHVNTINVRKFSMGPALDWIREPVVIDGQHPSQDISKTGEQTFFVTESGSWHAHDENIFSTQLSVPPGTVQNVFDTSGPITIVIPSDSSIHHAMLTVALRIAHSLDVYLKLDGEILTDADAAQLLDASSYELNSIRERLRGNLVILGGSENLLSQKLLQVPYPDRKTEFGLSESGQWLFRNRPLQMEDKDFGVLFTHPHPVNPSGSAVFLSGGSDNGKESLEGLERVLRLFVPRTGIAVPDWIIVGKEADRLGAGGVIGAGVWNSKWKWNEAVSFMP